MSMLVPGLRYSTHPAPVPEATRPLTVDAVPQIPRRPTGVVTRRGIGYRDGLRLDRVTSALPGPHPLVVYVPGGGFVRAPRGLARRERAFVAAAGYAVASVQYRTVRQNATVTDGLGDVRAAVDHLTDQAESYGIDAGRIGLWGESAGGYLPSMAGLTDARIRAVVDEFGASDPSVLADGFDERMRTALADPRHPVHRYRASETNPVDLVRAPPRRSCSCTATMTASSRPHRPSPCTGRYGRPARTAPTTCWLARVTGCCRSTAARPGSGAPSRC